MSGRQKGLLAKLMRMALRAASWPYGIAIKIRNRRFDSGGIESVKCDVPVVSIGNLTTGGTGKTPVVAWIAKWFRDRDIRVAIVSRGYGRGEQDQNDEAAELHERLPDVPHLQDPNRIQSAQIAVDELDSQVILMDDGFQHRHLKRDLDIVLIDMTCPFGYGYVLPRGLLREPASSLRRASAVILTRCDQVSAEHIDSVVGKVHAFNDTLPIVRCSHRPSGLLSYPAAVTSIDELAGRRICALSGIGNPDAFHETLRSVGADVVATRTFADHASFDRQVINELAAWIETQNSFDEIVCTHKDLVKLQTDRLAGKPLRALMIEAAMDDSKPIESLLADIV